MTSREPIDESVGRRIDEARWTHARSQDARRDPATGGAAGSRRREALGRDRIVRLQPPGDLQMAQGGGGTRPGPAGAALDSWHRSTAQLDPEARAPGVSLDQWTRPTPVPTGLRSVDAPHRRAADQAQVRHWPGRHRSGRAARQARAHAAEAVATCLPARTAVDR